jgi:hypothetical protein
MAKVFGILLIVVGIWTGIEVMNHGMGGAFGGLFADLGLAEASVPEQSASVGQRAGGAFDRAYRESENRLTRQLDED